MGSRTTVLEPLCKLNFLSLPFNSIIETENSRHFVAYVNYRCRELHYQLKPRFNMQANDSQIQSSDRVMQGSASYNIDPLPVILLTVPT
jgi:hypothetical protein